VKNVALPSAKHLVVAHLNILKLKNYCVKKRLDHCKASAAKWAAHLPPLLN